MSESNEYLPVILPYKLSFLDIPLSNMSVNIDGEMMTLENVTKIYIKEGKDFTLIGDLGQLKRDMKVDKDGIILTSRDGRTFKLNDLGNRLFILKPNRVISRPIGTLRSKLPTGRMTPKIDGYDTNGDTEDEDLMTNYVAPPRRAPDSGGRRRKSRKSRKSSNKKRKQRKTKRRRH